MAVKQKISKSVKTVRKIRASVNKPAVKLSVPKKTAKNLKKTVNSVQKRDAAGTATLPVISAGGESNSTVRVDKKMFEAKINEKLISQTIRVYLANQRAGTAQVKTRGKVEGSTRKIYRQKGTGKARHGSIRAPIFVGGGIVFGPVVRDFRLSIPQKMKRLSLAGSLSYQKKQGNVSVVDGLDKLKQKTKIMAKLMDSVAGKNSILFAVDPHTNTCIKAIRNIRNIDIIPAASLNTYEVLKHRKIIFTREGLEMFSGLSKTK
jgi:large subunit ribosomal protein L4